MASRIPALAILAAALPLGAQTGSITGQVSDPSGATIPGASVTVTNLGTAVVTETSTNTDSRRAALRDQRPARWHLRIPAER